MTMISAISRNAAERKLNRFLPRDRYLSNQVLPSRFKLHDLLVVESDGEYWFNTDAASKQCKLDGLTEIQENVKLYTGHTHCPACKADLAASSPTSLCGFYDYDITTVRIKHQFACKKCRHEWGTKIESGATRDGSLVAVAAGPRTDGPVTLNMSEPKPGTAGAAAFAVADREYARPDRSADWKTFRNVVIAAGVAEGQNQGNVGTELPRWARIRKVYHFA